MSESWLNLEGKTVIVTGGASGIGKAVAQGFLNAGSNVVISDMAPEAPEMDEAAGKLLYVKTDVTKVADVEAMVEKAKETFGTIDVLVNNAGINSRYRFEDLPLEEWDRMLRTNLTSAFYTCKCVVPHMLEQKSGCIINMSSSAGKTAHPNASICYGVSKAGINSLTQKLAYDLAPSGIRVNAVCPGPIETDMSQQWTPEYREQVYSAIPLRRLGTGEDVANVAVFLASEMSAFIVGESINVNGGKYMN